MLVAFSLCYETQFGDMAIVLSSFFSNCFKMLMFYFLLLLMLNLHFNGSF